MRYRLVTPLLVLFALSVFGADEKKATRDTGPKDDARGWKPLFDGRTLAGWKTTEFGAHAEPKVEEGILVLPAGEPLTGVTREKDDVPHVNYEVSLDAQRAEGSDFFVGLTFPVEKSFASLILGGWSGGVCGISSLDNQDASENSTTSYRTFETGKWYKVRLRVLKNRLEAWLDDEQIVDVDTEGKRIGIRIEVSASKPFGFASYRTKAKLKNIKIREIPEAELKQIEKDRPPEAGVDPSKPRK